MESANEIDTPECWEKLGTAALQQGKYFFFCLS
jgi:hypothetical protein